MQEYVDDVACKCRSFSLQTMLFVAGGLPDCWETINGDIELFLSSTYT